MQGKAISGMSRPGPTPLYQAESILSRRDHSEGELRDKLHKKGVARSDIEAVIVRLKQRHLIDDTSFAKQYIEQTLRRKAVGRRWLSYKLQQKKVAPEIIAVALDEIYPPEAEHNFATQAATIWRARQSGIGDGRRLGTFLLSRGFSHHTVQAVTASSRSLS